MDYLQASTPAPNSKLKSQLLRLLLTLNFIAIIITFSFNFLGLPLLKYHYLIHVLLAFLGIIFFHFSQIFPILLTLFFIEGQGRIIWEYANWSRIVFDFLALLAILKIFISTKKLVDFKKVPTPLIFLILAHFSWYLIEFSNLYSVSYFAILASSKIYIYPILLFIGLVQSDLNVESKNFKTTLNFFILLLILEIALTLFQFTMKEQLLLKISPFYFKIMKEGTFAGMLFRPFGTTQLPGAISVFFFLTVGLLYLRKETKLEFFLRTLIITASGLAIILCQVRSAFIKFVLIILAIHLGELLFHRFKAKSFSGLILTSLILIAASQYVLKSQLSSGDDSIDYVRDRISSLSDVGKVKGSRLSLAEFTKIASTKLIETPMGIGPGLTGAAGSISKDELAGNRFVNVGMTWTSDNLFISLIIDFGFGAIFYILILIYIPFYFFRFLVIFFKNKSLASYKSLLICFSTIFVILIGNWGAIGITYNPESFIFWFFSALGFSTIAKFKKDELAKI